MKAKIIGFVIFIFIGGIIYYSNNPQLHNAEKVKFTEEIDYGPFHAQLMSDDDYNFYYGIYQDSSLSKRLYKAEKHLQLLENIRYKLDKDDDIGFNDSSFVKDGILYLRFIFSAPKDSTHKYAYNMNTDYQRTKAFEVKSDIEFTEKVTIESNYSKIDSEKFLNKHGHKIEYNTEKWRKDAFDTGMEYLRSKIPNMEKNCYVVSQGNYQPVLVSYKGDGVFKIMAKTNFDCSQNYINKRLFLITMIHYPAVGWEATINDIKFLD